MTCKTCGNKCHLGACEIEMLSEFTSLPGQVQKTESALDVQIGGGHYKDMAIQPMEYSMKNGLDACQHTAIKYISRFRDKGGIEDLRKAKHCIDMLIQFEQEKNQ